jgi:vacuolar protein sorting-associated protein 13A/C
LLVSYSCLSQFDENSFSTNLFFVAADYYDSSLNLWNELLTEPWEITLKVARSPNRRSRSKRLSTTIDLESFPCVVSFSEQFLVSLAGANRMWSIFSVATTVTTESADQDPSMSSRDLSLRQSMAASAARNLVTSLPYAVENHSGADASFLLPGRREDCRLCPNGKIQYFRFEPPQGSGYGGKRLYGQEVSYEKSVTIFFPDCAVEIGHLDSLLGQPRMAHELGDGRILLTQVVKEGKTTVGGVFCFYFPALSTSTT